MPQSSHKLNKKSKESLDRTMKQLETRPKESVLKLKSHIVTKLSTATSSIASGAPGIKHFGYVD